MDYDIMTREQAIALGVVRPDTGSINIPRAKKVDQHSPRPSLDSMSTTELFNVLLPRAMQDNALENVSEHVLFALWVRLDEEIQQRRQPEFVHMEMVDGDDNNDDEDGGVFSMREGGVM
jgi:hypothetical protein